MRIASLIFLLLVSGVARAADVSVTSATDLKKAIKAAQPGDNLILADGDYKDLDVKFFAVGAEGKPIILRAQTTGKVRMTGTSKIHLGGNWLTVDGFVFTDGYVDAGSAVSFRDGEDKGATNCRITNCAFIDFNPVVKPEKKQNTQWISLYGADNEVDHCYFKGKDNNGPMLVVWVEDQPNRHHIHDNFFAGRPPLGENGGETMRIGTSEVSMNVSRALVENNYFEHCDGEAEIISSKSCENVYRYNTFVECKGALVLRHGHRNTVEGNWFFGHQVPGTGGIRLINEDQKIFNNYLDGLYGENFESAMPVVDGIPDSKPNEYYRVKRATVCFNTLVNCKQNLTFGVGFRARNRIEPAMDCTYANNVFMSEHGPLVSFLDKPINTTWISNYFFGSDSGLDEKDGKVLDPKLVRDTDEVYRPAQDSPLVGAASGDFDFVKDDIEGRPRGAVKDVGCFQHEGQAVRHPLTAAEVGPGWMKPSK